MHFSVIGHNLRLISRCACHTEILVIVLLAAHGTPSYAWRTMWHFFYFQFFSPLFSASTIIFRNACKALPIMGCLSSQHSPQEWDWSALCATHRWPTMRTNRMPTACTSEKRHSASWAKWYAFRIGLVRQIQPTATRGPPHAYVKFWLCISGSRLCGASCKNRKKPGFLIERFTRAYYWWDKKLFFCEDFISEYYPTNM